MACPSQSGRAWVTAAMFIGRLRWQSGGVGVRVRAVEGRGGSALFRQELGLSSDSKIRLIYDISTAVFPTTPLTLADKRPAGRRWHSAKLFVCLPLTFAAKDHFPSPRQTCCIGQLPAPHPPSFALSETQRKKSGRNPILVRTMFGKFVNMNLCYLTFIVFGKRQKLYLPLKKTSIFSLCFEDVCFCVCLTSKTSIAGGWSPPTGELWV